MGNHDVCHPCNKKKSAPALEEYQKLGFRILGLESAMEIAGHNVRLHHMPYLSEDLALTTLQPKHKKFRPDDDGRWLLHGHIHEKWKTKDRMINVGVDVWDFYPVSILKIEKIIYEQDRADLKNLNRSGSS